MVAANELFLKSVCARNITSSISLVHDHEANVNAMNSSGVSALHITTAKEDLDFMQTLLDLGGDVNIANTRILGGVTPLFCAIQDNHLKAAKLLLDNKADPNVISLVNGFTPLHVAAKANNIEAAKLLLSYGVDPNIRDSSGFNASYWAFEFDHHGILNLAGMPNPRAPTREEICERLTSCADKATLAAGSKKKKSKKGGKKGKK